MYGFGGFREGTRTGGNKKQSLILGSRGELFLRNISNTSEKGRGYGGPELENVTTVIERGKKHAYI